MSIKTKKHTDCHPVSFQVASDLHIEHIGGDPDPFDFITPSAPLLILAGDIGSLYHINQLQNFLKKLCGAFEAVCYVPGNYEFYTWKTSHPVSMDILLKRLHCIAEKIPNLYILNRSSIKIGNVCIAGCTLWSDPLIKIPKYLVRINNMDNSLYKSLHDRDLRYIEKMISYCAKKRMKLVMVTHHVPTFKVMPSNRRRRDLDFSSLYATNLESLLQSNISAWICGHIHRNFDEIVGSTRLVGNQKGKPKDKITDYEMKKIVTIV